MTAPILGVPLAELRATRTSVKWRLYPPDVLPLWVAEMDARPCPAVVCAVSDAVARGDTGYGWADPYAEAYASYATRSWGWAPDPDGLVAMADVMSGVAAVLRLVTDPGGPVVLSAPVYNAFYGFLEAIGRRAVEAPLLPSGRLDLEALRVAFATTTRTGERTAYLLCNPHNPTGVAHTRSELTQLASLAREFGVRVVADEIHAPLVYAPGAFVPYLSVPGSEDAVSVFSPSKGWNLAGLKAALMAGGPAAQATLRAIPEVLTHAASHLGVIAHLAALTAGEGWLAQLLTELDANRRLLARLLEGTGVGYAVPEATYLAWLDLRSFGLGPDPATVLRERCGVALSSGPHFGTPGAGFARLNFATSPEILEEAVGRLLEALPGSG